MERRISCNEREWEDGTNILCSREQDQVNNVGAVILYVASIFGYQGEQGLGWSRVYVMRRNNLRGAAGGSWSDHKGPHGQRLDKCRIIAPEKADLWAKSSLAKLKTASTETKLKGRGCRRSQFLELWR